MTGNGKIKVRRANELLGRPLPHRGCSKNTSAGVLGKPSLWFSLPQPTRADAHRKYGHVPIVHTLTHISEKGSCGEQDTILLGLTVTNAPTAKCPRCSKQTPRSKEHSLHPGMVQGGRAAQMEAPATFATS